MGTVTIKRVYEEPEESDGYRVLVDRLWPRGVSHERAHVNTWLKDVAPTPNLRKRWHHAPDHFDEFARDYRNELASNSAADELRDIIRQNSHVTLVYGARDQEKNHARVLASYLAETDEDS